MAQNVVIGIDGGGTNTRVLVVDLHGNALAYVESGGSNPHLNDDAEDNIQSALRMALSEAGCKGEHVVSIVAGLSGINEADDYEWANRFVSIEGMAPDAKRMAVNDSVIAQTGAFHGEPGIIAISGTGSIVFGMNETGLALRNYDFRHYAASTARHISHELLFRIIAGQYESADKDLVMQILEYWNVKNIGELSQLAAAGFVSDELECKRMFGLMCPLVTSAAERDIPLAKSVCDRAAFQVATGVRIIGTSFQAGSVDVAFIGSVIRTPYLTKAVSKCLHEQNTHDISYRIQDPQYPPIVGAVLLAFKEAGVRVRRERLSHFEHRHVESRQSIII